MATDRFYDDALLSAVYDAWHPRSVRDDYDFYLPHILDASNVLDVGCGTGTLLREARESGHRGHLCGLDPAPGVLDRAREVPSIAWVLGRLEEQSWDERFDLIVMTGHAFQSIVADAELAGFLAAVRRALKPGGVFAFETRSPAARAWERWAGSGPARVALPDGTAVEIATRIDAGFDGKTVTFTHTFSGALDGLPMESRSTLRFLGADELASHLVEAGLRIAEQFGDFEGNPLAPQSPEIITFAGR